MSKDGILAPFVFPGAMNAAVFEGYVRQVLGPELQPGDTVVFDRLSAHLTDGVRLWPSAKRGFSCCRRTRPTGTLSRNAARRSKSGCAVRPRAPSRR